MYIAFYRILLMYTSCPSDRILGLNDLLWIQVAVEEGLDYGVFFLLTPSLAATVVLSVYLYRNAPPKKK